MTAQPTSLRTSCMLSKERKTQRSVSNEKEHTYHTLIGVFVLHAGQSLLG